MGKNIGEQLKQALISGKVNFKKSKYDLPEPTSEKKKRKGTTIGRHVFGAPVESEPKMDYIQDPRVKPSFAQAAAEQLRKSQEQEKPAKKEKTTLKKAKDKTGSLIDDLFKSVKK
jgi:hypothetical protein